MRYPSNLPSLPLGFIVGAGAGLVVGLDLAGAVATGLLGSALAFVLPIPWGLLAMRRGRSATPVELPTPHGPISQADYASMSLAARNGAIAEAVGRTTNTPPEAVARLLPELMARQRISNLATQRAAAAVMAGIDRSRIDVELYKSILAAEVHIATSLAQPRDDANRAKIEQNLGGPLTYARLVELVLSARLARLGITIREAMEEAVDGRLDLAFVVGAIRRIGEHNARRIATIR